MADDWAFCLGGLICLGDNKRFYCLIFPLFILSLMTQVAFIPLGRHIRLMSCNASILCSISNVVLAIHCKFFCFPQLCIILGVSILFMVDLQWELVTYSVYYLVMFKIMGKVQPCRAKYEGPVFFKNKWKFLVGSRNFSVYVKPFLQVYVLKIL